MNFIKSGVGITMLGATLGASATTVDITMTGVIDFQENRVPSTLYDGESFVAHYFINTDAAPASYSAGTYNRSYFDNQADPHWLDFSISFEGKLFIDTRSLVYATSLNRIDKVLDQPRGENYLDILRVESTKTLTDNYGYGLFLDSSTVAAFKGFYFNSFDLGSSISLTFPIAGAVSSLIAPFNFSYGTISTKNTAQLSPTAISSSVILSAVPEPASYSLLITGLALFSAGAIRTRRMARQTQK